MKTILVDAVFCLVDEKGNVDEALYELLETFPNKKIILTGANDEQMKTCGLDKMPYEVFTLKHDPEKTDLEYYKILLKKLDLSKDDVVYFEHSEDAVESARSIGIETYFYDFEKKDMIALQEFLDGVLKD